MRTRLLQLVATSAIAFAQPSAQDGMIARSVQVYGTIQENGKATPVSLGGGVVADAHHVITAGGCCNKTKEGEQKTPVVHFGDQFAAAKVVWNGPGDLVILDVDKELKAPALAVIPAKVFQKGQKVYTVTIPQQGSPTVAESTADEVTHPDKVPVSVIRSKATSDSVDAGSALFDACGNVMGINLFVDSGAQFAFIIDPVVDGLQKVGIKASGADSACGGGDKSRTTTGEKDKDKKKGEAAESSWRLPQGGEWVGVAIIVGLIALALRRGARQPARIATAIPDPPPYQSPNAVPVPLKPGKPALRGIAGQYAGVTIPLDNTTILGRDPQTANLVFTFEADSVSKRHSVVRWDAARSVFVLEDLGSTNGTFLANGERLVAGQPRDLRPGERFYIGDQKNQFEAALD
jgi:hypothetical protein